eukprot:gene320-950_t
MADSDPMCYNKGCGNRFKEEDNDENSCSYHPGAPIFHEGYKSWSCCKKKSTDFTDFLNFPGCTKGLHNKEKPEVPVKQKEKPLQLGVVIKEEAKPAREPAKPKVEERPSDDLPKNKLKAIVASSLKAALQKYKENQQQQKENLNSKANSDAVLPGAPCKNNACNKAYVSDNSEKADCQYHPGQPIFHEGYKYWTCCKKRTSEFSEFLKQAGCQKGQHDWQKPSEAAQKKSACRYDWHQTGSFVYISIYAKTSDFENTHVEANETSLYAHISFNGGLDLFQLNLSLHGLIDPCLSQVEMMGTKVEIKMKKKEPCAWKTLEFSKPCLEKVVVDDATKS